MAAMMNFGLLSKPGTALGGRSRSQLGSPGSPGVVRFSQAPAPQPTVITEHQRSIMSHVNLSSPSDVSDIPDYDIFSHTESEVVRSAGGSPKEAARSEVSRQSGDPFGGLDSVVTEQDDGFGGDPVEAFATALAASKQETAADPPRFTSDAANNYYSAMQIRHAEGGSISGSKAAASRAVSLKKSAKDTLSKLKKPKGGSKKAAQDAEKYPAEVAAALAVVKTPEEVAQYVLALEDDKGVDKMDLYGAIVSKLKEREASTAAKEAKTGGGAKPTPEATPMVAPAPPVNSVGAAEPDAASTASSVTQAITVATEKASLPANPKDTPKKGARKSNTVEQTDDPPLAEYPSPIDSPEEVASPDNDTKIMDAYAVLDRVGLPEGLKLPKDDEEVAEESTEESSEGKGSEQSSEESSGDDEDELIMEQSVEHSIDVFAAIKAEGVTHATAAEATLQRQKELQELRQKNKKKGSSSPMSKAGKKLRSSVRSMSPIVFVKGSGSGADDKSKVTGGSDDTTVASSTNPASAGSDVAVLPITSSDGDARECIDGDATPRTKASKKSFNPMKKGKKALPPRIPSRASPGVMKENSIRSIVTSSDDDGSVECYSVSGDELNLSEGRGDSNGTSEETQFADGDEEWPQNNRNTGGASPVSAAADEAPGKKKKSRMAAAREMYQKKALPKSPGSAGKEEGEKEEEKEEEERGGANTDGVASVPSLEEESVGGSSDAAVRLRKKDRFKKIIDYRRRASPLPRKKVSQKTLDGWLAGKKKDGDAEQSADMSNLVDKMSGTIDSPTDTESKNQSYSRTDTDSKNQSYPTETETSQRISETRLTRGDGSRSEKLSLVPAVSRDPSTEAAAPLKQIRFDPNCDNNTQADLSLPPELANAKKIDIWSEQVSPGVDEESQERSNAFMFCGDAEDAMTYKTDGMTNNENDSILDLTVDDTVGEKTGGWGRRRSTDKKAGRPLFICGIDVNDVKNDVTYEIRESIKDVQWGMKQGVKKGVNKLFGACDITNQGGVDYLQRNMSNANDQLFGRAPYKHPTSPTVTPAKKKTNPQTANPKTANPEEEKTSRPRNNDMQKEASTVIPGGIETAYEGGKVQTLEKKPEPEKKQLTPNEKKSLYLEKLKALSMKHL